MRILIKNGKIYDGTGSEAFAGDILVEDERIAAVAPSITESADKVIDLKGLSVSSGFFDAHSHNDWFCIKKDTLKYFEPFIRQGITSFVTGNCGLSAVGFEPDTPYVDKIGGGLFKYDGTTTGVYPSVKSFFDAIDRNNPCNIAVIVGTGTFKTKDELHRILDDLRKEGADVWFDIYNETVGVSTMTVFLPSWFQSLSPEERGYVKPGYFADLTVFDEAEMAAATPDRERAFGISRVFINGHEVLSGDVLDKEALKTSGHALKV